jgi:nicotinate-nucleotide pyrophosphorylase
MQMKQKYIDSLIKNGLDEDLGKNGDITSNYTISASKKKKIKIKNT